MPTIAKETEIEQRFAAEGYVILRQVLNASVVRGAQAAIASLVDQVAQQRFAARKIDDLFESEPFETRYLRLFEGDLDAVPFGFRNELHLEAMYPLLFAPPLLDFVEGLLGPEVRIYPNYTVRPKLPDHAGTEVPWHQDAGYTKARHQTADGEVSTLSMVNLWTPLVPALVENGCMQFVSGSHRQGVVLHEDDGGRYIQIPPNVISSQSGMTVNIELDPGDVVLFSNLLFHRGLPNQSDSIRWSCDWRFQDATQPTLRREEGHLARSLRYPEHVVESPTRWAQLSFA